MIALFVLLAAAEPDPVAQLPTVKRIYVDRFTGGLTAAQMREMVIASLQGSKLFIVTENEERADAVLRGAAEDLVFTETHSSEDSLHGRTATGKDRGSGAARMLDRNALSVGEQESSKSSERKHEATATVRIVLKNGDVIWSTTQESMGGKFRGASADVADRITRQLAADFDRARKLAPAK